jgi:hypothetical protein
VLATVYYDRVTWKAGRMGMPTNRLLGRAVAHELGHLLLPPSAHESGGIMREAWNPRLLPPQSPGIQGFSSRQARLLRLRTRR